MGALPADLHALRKAYGTLGVPIESSAHAIKQEYRRRAKLWHPDKWAAGSEAQQRAAVQMRELNEAYGLIRHAPLRYHIESHPRVEARAERRGTPLRREAVAVTDHGESIGRFVLGSLVGALVSLVLFWSATTASVPLLLAIPVACGALSVIFGDSFWHLLLELLFWW